MFALRKLLSVAVVFAMLAFAAPAAAQSPRGVVLRFRGPASSQARTAVVRAVGDTLDLERQDDARSAARRLGVSLDSRSGISAIAQDMGLAVVVQGRVVGRGRNAVTELHIIDDAGNEVSFREVPGNPRGRSGRRAIGEAAVEAVEQALGAISQRGQEEQNARIAPTEDLGDPDDLQDEGNEDDEPRELADVPFVAAYLGYGGRTRHAEVDVEGGARRVYDSSLFSELVLHADVHPLASGSAGAQGLYVGFDLSVALGLSSSEAGATDEIDTKAYRLRVDLGYLARIADNRAQVGALVGFGVDSFKLGANTVLPSSSYPQLRVGALGRYDLIQDVLFARVDLGFRYAFGVGDLADSFGSGGSALGFDLGLGVGGIFEAGFAWGLRFGYDRLSLDFSGDAADAPGTGGSDASISLGVHLGWAIR